MKNILSLFFLVGFSYTQTLAQIESVANAFDKAIAHTVGLKDERAQLGQFIVLASGILKHDKLSKPEKDALFLKVFDHIKGHKHLLSDSELTYLEEYAQFARHQARINTKKQPLAIYGAAAGAALLLSYAAYPKQLDETTGNENNQQSLTQREDVLGIVQHTREKLKRVDTPQSPLSFEIGGGLKAPPSTPNDNASTQNPSLVNLSDQVTSKLAGFQRMSTPEPSHKEDGEDTRHSPPLARELSFSETPSPGHTAPPSSPNNNTSDQSPSPLAQKQLFAQVSARLANSFSTGTPESDTMSLSPTQNPLLDSPSFPEEELQHQTEEDRKKKEEIKELENRQGELEKKLTHYSKEPEKYETQLKELKLALELVKVQSENLRKKIFYQKPRRFQLSRRRNKRIELYESVEEDDLGSPL